MVDLSLPIQEWIQRLRVLSDNLKIADIGFGDGELALTLAKRGYEVSAVDPDPGFVRKLKRVKTQQRLATLRVVQAKAENLPIPNNSQDLVMVREVIEHVDDVEQALGEIARILKKEGWLYITFPTEFTERVLNRLNHKFLSNCGHRQIISLKSLTKALTARGFEILDIKKKGVFWFIFWLAHTLAGSQPNILGRTSNHPLLTTCINNSWLLLERLQFAKAINYCGNPLFGKSYVIWAVKR